MSNNHELRHAKAGKSVNDRGADVGFGHLPLEGSKPRAVVLPLEPLYQLRCKPAPATAAILLPAANIHGRDVLENRIPGLITSQGCGGVPRRDGCTAGALADGGRAIFGLVGAIDGHPADTTFELANDELDAPTLASQSLFVTSMSIVSLVGSFTAK